MRTLTRFVKSVAAIALAAVVVSCGSNSNSAAPASLRFVNATTNQSLSVTMNGNGQFSHVAATSATGYAHVVPSNYTISVTSDSGALASSTQIQGIPSSQTYTLLAYQRNNAIVASLIIEDQAAPPSGYSTVAASNSSPDAGTLDVYVVTPGTTNLAGLSPNF